jgi:RNA polymerase sigma-70 factor (ECF subfamily)
VDLERASDRELIEAARTNPGTSAEFYLNALYARYYRKVAYWCLRVCGNREEAADLAQDVFMRVHSRLDSFRMDSSFSTWLYTVTRSVAINRGKRAQRRQETLVDMNAAPEPAANEPGPEVKAERNELLARVKNEMEHRLDPLEAKVLYLHHVHGLTLPAITTLLELRNKSGAKSYLVGGMRKLRSRLRFLSGGEPRDQEQR